MRPTLDMQNETLVATLAYLQEHHPLPNAHFSYFTKVQGPKFHLKRLTKGYYGYVSGYHQSLEAFICTTPRPQLDLIDTICHEWRHMHQDLSEKGLYNWYKRRIRTGYWNHPLEKDARAFAEEVTNEIWTLSTFPWWPSTIAEYEASMAEQEIEP